MEKTRDVNKKIHDCIFNLRTKVTDALNKDIHYAKVNGVEDASLKLINCLVEHEVVNKILLFAKHKTVKANQEHLVQENVPWDETGASLLEEDDRKQLHSDGDEDGYKSDTVINSSTYKCEENETYYKCRVSLLEDQKIKLENDILKLAEERNELTEKLLKTRIFNEDPSETLCLKNTNLESTIQRHETLILEKQKRENQMQDELKDAEQALKHTKTQLEKCRDEKNDAKTKLSICDFEKDKLQCETDQLQQRLKKQKKQAEELISSLEKKIKDKEKDIKQRTQCNDEMTKELKEIKIQKQELQLRNQHDQENSKQLAQDNELLRSKLCEFENKLDKSAEEVMTMKEEQDKLQSCLGEKSNQLNESEARFKKLETDIKVLQNIGSENEVLKASLEEMSKELNNIELKYRNATTMEQDADRNIQELNKTIENQKQENRDVHGITERLEEEKKDLENKLRETYEQSDQKKEEIDIIQKRLKIAEEKSSKLENAEYWKTELKQLRESFEHVTHQLDVLEKSYEREKIIFDRLKREKYTTDHANCTLTLRLNQMQKDSDKLKQVGYNKFSSPQHTIMLDDRKIKLKDKIISLKRQKAELEASSRKFETETKKIKSSFEDQTLELESLKKKYSEEAAFRASNDKIHIQHNNELQQLIKEKEDMSRNYEENLCLCKIETEDKNRENAELIKDKGKLEKEIDDLKLRYSEEAALRESNDKLHIQHNNELQQLIKEKEDMSRNYEENLCLCKIETEDKNRENAELIKDKGKLEKEIDDLKLRLLEDIPDMALNQQVGKETIKRAQVLVHYDEFVQQKSHKLGSKMKQLYKHEWKEAMTELESEDEQINIKFLLQILEKAYSFSEDMVPRLADGFKAILLSVSIDIEEIVDSTFLIREILDLLTNCMRQIFLRNPDSKQYKTNGRAVNTYIREAVALCWLMAIQKPPVFISTVFPNKSQLESFDPYVKSKSETIDYVVWPVVKLSNNEGQIICTGIAEYK